LLLVVVGIATVVGGKVWKLWRSYVRNVKAAERTGFYVVRARELCFSWWFVAVLGNGEGSGKRRWRGRRLRRRLLERLRAWD
jgi:hypothetical protein